MFEWGKKKDGEVVENVCSRIRPLFGILEHRLGRMPQEMASDPYVVGYVIGAATVFTQIETTGKATTELRGRASLAAIQTAFAPLGLTLQDASAAMRAAANHPDVKRGSRAADLIISVGAGRTDCDSEPEIIAAKQAVAAMPHSIRKMLGGTPQSLLMNELQEQLFFSPLEAKYGARDA